MYCHYWSHGCQSFFLHASLKLETWCQKPFVTMFRWLREARQSNCRWKHHMRQVRSIETIIMIMVAYSPENVLIIIWDNELRLTSRLTRQMSKYQYWANCTENLSWSIDRMTHICGRQSNCWRIESNKVKVSYNMSLLSLEALLFHLIARRLFRKWWWCREQSLPRSVGKTHVS